MTDYAALRDVVDKVNAPDDANFNRTATNLESDENQEIMFETIPEEASNEEIDSKEYVKSNFSEEEFMEDEGFDEVSISPGTPVTKDFVTSLPLAGNSVTADKKERVELKVTKNKRNTTILSMPQKPTVKSGNNIPVTLRDMDEMKKVHAEFSSLDLTNSSNYRKVDDLVDTQIDELLKEMATMSLEQIEKLSAEEQSIFKMYYVVQSPKSSRNAIAKFCRFKKLADPNLLDNPAIKATSTKFKTLVLKLVRSAEFDASLNDTLRINVTNE